MADALQRIAALSDEKRELLELLRQEKLRKKRAAAAPSFEAPEPAPFALMAEADQARLPDGVEDAYPLTLMQAGMLYHMEREPEHALYHNVDTFRVEGLFRPDLFQRAVDLVVRRHPVLRTSFDLHSYSEPLQLVHQEAHLQVRVEDLRGAAPELQKAAIDAYTEAEKARRFDFSSPPLLRLGVHLLEERVFQFTVTDFHPILDGWSLQSTLAEVLSLYGAMLSGEEPPEAPLPASTFRQFVHLERQALASEEHRLWWERLLEGASPIRLPRWPQPAHLPGARAFCTLAEEVPAYLFDTLRELARVAEVPLKSVFLACHLKAMELLAGRSDILTGLVSQGRPEGPGGEDVRGLFLNTVPFRMRLPRGSWIDLARAVFEAERELVPYRRYPLPALQQRWGQERLFDAAFNFTHFHVYRDVFETLERSGHGLRVVDGEMREETSFTLLVSFNVEPLGRGMHIAFLCHLLELPEPEVAAIVALYFRLLRAMTSEPIGDHSRNLGLLGESERHALLLEWNDTAVFRELSPVHERFAARAELQPDAEAVRCGERSLSYGELRRLSAAWAARLRRQGVGTEDLVAICLDRSPEAVVAILAVLAAGGAYVPLDPGYPGERLAYMLEDSGARLLLTSRRLSGVLPPFGGPILFLEGEPERGATPTPARPLPESLAYLLYTSGSTGRPKGVAMSHGALANLIEWQLGVSDRPRGRTLQFAPLSFDVSFQEIFSTLCAGGTLVLLAEETRRDIPALLGLLREERIERLFLPFVALQHLAETVADSGTLPADLREVITAGEQLQVSPGVRALFRRLPGCSLHNQYGPTEAHVVSALPLRDDPDAWPVLPSIGRPIANDQLHILGEGLDAVPIGVAGELCIGGTGLARGYLGRPHLTAERFIPDPFTAEPGRRLYRTGDLARYLPDGNLEFLGRADRQVKVRGFRIELGEIEATLAGHPVVREAVVALREDTPGRKRLVAYVALRLDAAAGARELRAWLAERLPEYEIPSATVLLDRLPLTPSGKVDRRALPAFGETEGFVAPRTPVEEVLAAIWAEVLHIEHVGAEDDFFELGGHSLIATQVIARAREIFHVNLPVRALFESPTLSGLARQIEAARRTGAEVEAPLLRRGSRGVEAPVSFAQRRLWFIHRLDPASPAYNIPAAVRLSGSLDAAALANAFSEVIRRHESLRTTFSAADGEPVQRIAAPPASFPLPLVDLSALPASELDAESRRLVEEESLGSFDLESGPLLRVRLVRLGTGEHLALATVHHIASDGWSMEILVQEVAELYGAFAAGRPSPLPPLPLQYADYAEWQRAWLHGGTLEREVAWWRKRLSGALPRLNLPTDRPRRSLRSERGAALPLRLTSHLVQIRALARSYRATLFMTLLAAFQTVLARWSGEEDVIIGTPVAGRTHIELESLIGVFVNTLVLRADLTGDPTFADLVVQARERTLEAHAYQKVPFEKLVEDLQPERSLAHTPLFQVMLVLLNTPRREIETAGLRLTAAEGAQRTETFDLTLMLREGPQELEGSLSYSSELFDAATIQRLLDHLRNLLAAAVASPTLCLGDLPLLGEAERWQVVGEWNDTGLLRSGPCFPQLLERCVASSPDATALVCGDESWTYERLNRAVNRLAHHLRRLGIGPEVRVGLAVEPSAEMILGVLGILKAGGAYVPLDLSYPRERLALLLEDSGLEALVTMERSIGALPAHAARVVCLDRDQEAIGRESPEDPVPLATAGNLAYVIYTSGSTGRPKGVLVEHRSLAWYAEVTAACYGIGPGSRVVQQSSISFDISVEEIFPCLASGGELLVHEERLATAEGFLHWCRQREVTALFLATAFWHELGVCIAADLEIPPSLRVVSIGGEKVLPERVASWLQAAGPEHRLFNSYGPTETTVVATLRRVDGAADRPGREIPIGRPISKARTCVVDHRGNLAPLGVPGELRIGGAGMARGYLGLPSLTAERFVPDPWFPEPGGRLYRTGDLVRWLPEAELEFLGRIDQQVKVRGFRVEPGEVESLLSEHPDVAEVAVLAERDPGGGSSRLVAYLAKRPGHEFLVSALRSFLRERLPEYMVPSLFIFLTALPLTPNGKVDRQALAGMELPDHGGPEASEAPHTPAEEIVAGIWAEVLGLERVGARDHFFELGGHSLLATRVVSRVRDAFGVVLPLRDLFEEPTVTGLARRIEAVRRQQTGTLAMPLVRMERTERLPLSFGQERLWFLDQLQPGSPAYNIPISQRLSGPLDPATLAAAFSEIVRRHEVLRTIYAAPEGDPVQVVSPPGPLPLPVLDLSALPEELRQAEALRLSSCEALRPFDLARDRMLRASLLRLGPEEYVVLATMHHIASDGWSTGIIIREMQLLYEVYRQGRPSTLEPLAVQYADFAIWQRRWLQGEVLETELAYWRERLAGAPPLLDLPLDRPRPKVQRPRGASVGFALPPEVSRMLQAFSRRQGATMFMVLLAGFQALLARYSAQEDISVGTPIAGRTRSEIEGLVGFFVNTLVVRTDLSGGPGLADLVRQVRERSLEAHLHQDMPFEKLVDELAPERSLSHAPLFQVMLAFQNTPQESLEVPGLSASSFGEEVGTEKFDFTLSLAEGPQGVDGLLSYNTDLFDGTTMQRLSGHFLVLLKALAEHPDEPFQAVPLLSEAERHHLLTEWNDSGAARGARSVPHQIAEQAAKTPEAVAVSFEGAGLSYRELDERANHLAAFLQGLGVGPGDWVGLCLERSLEMVIALLGVLKAGGAYVPLDPSYPRERLTYILRDCLVEVLLTQCSLREDLAVADLEVVCLDEDGPHIGRRPHPPAVELSGEELAYLIYTSGSTGRPKGAMVRHAGLSNHMSWMQERLPLSAADHVLQKTPFGFDASVWEFFAPLMAGARLVMARPEGHRDPAYLVRTVAEEEISILQVVPSLLSLLLEEEGLESCVSLRRLFCGGEALTPDLAGRLSARLQVELVNVYGPSEATIQMVFWTCPPGVSAAQTPLGRPIDNARVYVLDRQLQPAPLGVPGELVIGGACLGRGYLGRPDLTAERFVLDPFTAAGERLYRTGDLVRWRTDGQLDYLGRLDHQLKVRGFRVELGEIEAVLASHPAVREAVVLARPGVTGDAQLTAYLVAAPEGPPSTREIREHLSRQLPQYMIPSFFVFLAALPLTPNGKLDRRALPHPDDGSLQRDEPFTAPRNQRESVLAEIWAQTLGLDRVGVHDNFFALGGDSILSIRVRALAEQRGICFSLQEIFQHQTIAELVGALVDGAVEERSTDGSRPFCLIAADDLARMPAGVEDAYPTTALQLGMLFHSEYSPHSGAYHSVSSVRLRAPFDAEAFHLVARTLAQRHAVLRTSFHVSGFDEPLQLVHREVEIPWAVTDLRALPTGEQRQALDWWFEEEKRNRFDLRRAPALRFHIHLLGQEELEFGWTEHHAILDGWSVASMLAELLGSYMSRMGGKAAQLPFLPPVSFRDFVVLEREALSSPETRRFWQEKLDGLIPSRLPRRPEASGERQAEKGDLTVSAPPGSLKALQALSHSLGVPVKSVLLAAHLWVLRMLSGAPDVVTGLVSNGRPEVDGGDRILGLFLNTLPLRLRLPAGSWSDLIGRTFRAELEMMPYRRYPLAELQRTCGGQPLFDVTFNYTHFHVLQQVGEIDGAQATESRDFAETNFPVVVNFSRDVGRTALRLALQYDRSVMDGTQALRVSSCYLRILEAMTRCPSERHDLFVPLSDGELHQILLAWNDTQTLMADGRCVHFRVAENAERTPEAVALIHGDDRVTYRDLVRRARSLAARLRAAGVGRGDVVALLQERSPDLIVAQLAALEVGAAYLPIDPGTPAERAAFLLADAGAAALLTEPRAVAQLPEAAQPTVCLLAPWPADAGGEDFATPEADGSDLAYVIYTSGSTGFPKGVEIPHSGLANLVAWHQQAYPIRQGDRATQIAGLGFDASVWEVWPYLSAGASVHLVRPEILETPRSFWRWIAAEGITHCFLPTPLAEAMLDGLAPAEEEALADARLRVLLTGGDRLQRRPPRPLPFQFVNHYGPTESSVVTTAGDVAPGPEGGRPPSIGRPIDNLRVLVMDADLRPVPIGVPGELCVGGDGLARGYRGRAELTAERFVPDPSSATPGTRLYRTGDLVLWLPGGELEFLGRIDQQVKIRGFRVELGEIETVLAALPGVREAVVTARDGDGSGDLRLVAYVVPAKGASPDPADLRAALSARLPGPMVPSAWVILPDLPLNASGKVDRRALPAPTTAPAAARVEPRNLEELWLAGLWEELLGRTPVDVRDDFFELGGHSLLAVRLLAQIEAHFARKLTAATLFRHPSIEELAAALRREAGKSNRPVLVPIRTGGGSRPFFLAHPVGGGVLCYAILARRLDPQTDIWGLQAPVPDPERPSPRLEDLADLYLRAVREVQPEGPYRFGGWSMGGWIAFEMARRLRQQGQVVELLVLFDTHLPDPEKGVPGPAERVELFALDWLRAAGREVAGLPEFSNAEDPLRLAYDLAREADLLPLEMGWQQVCELFRMFEANLLAMATYEPEPFAGSLRLFRASASGEAEESWRRLAQEGFSVDEIPGDHYSILQAPDVDLLAKELGRLLAAPPYPHS